MEFKLTTPMGIYNDLVLLMLLLEIVLAAYLMAQYFGVI